MDCETVGSQWIRSIRIRMELQWKKRNFPKQSLLRWFQGFMQKNKIEIFQHLKHTERKWALGLSFFLFISFFILYFGISNQLSLTDVFNVNDALFEMDTARVINDMTKFYGNHSRVNVHPLYVLIVNPIGEVLGQFIQPDQKTAITINCFFGALGVLLGFYFFLLNKLDLSSAFLLACLFGFSTSQFFLSTFPDTASLAICSLITTYIVFLLALKENNIPYIIWVFAGLFTLAITTTNFLQTVICYFIYLIAKSKKRKWNEIILNISSYSFIVILLAMGLSLLQKAIYPSATLFFLPEAYYGEIKYTSTLIFTKPLSVLYVLFKSFLVDNIIAPKPIFFDFGGVIQGTTFTRSYEFSIIGLLALVLWIPLMVMAFAKNIRKKNNLHFFLGMIGCILINFLLHSVYGVGEKNRIELFLYTGNLTFMVFIILSDLLTTKSKLMKILVLLLVFMVAINNLMVMDKIFVNYQSHANLVDNAKLFEDEKWINISSFFALKKPKEDVNLIKFENRVDGSKLSEYENELTRFRNIFNARSQPEGNFFLFGMGERQKMIYKGGELIDSLTGKTIRHWEVVNEIIIPPDYTVILETIEGEMITIYEDEVGVWIQEQGELSNLSRGYVHLPTFEEYAYPNILRVLHQEILINIINGQPVPNYFVYAQPWYRDAAMVCMVLDETNNLHLVRDWILGLSEPFDRNNNGIEEPDNLGQVLYLTSLVSDKSHPIVKTILSELPKFENGNYIEGLTDFSPHPVYQTMWLKYGLSALGLQDKYEIPEVKDNYASLFWLDYQEENKLATRTSRSSDYPYLIWADAHFYQSSEGMISDQNYPLTWEANASEADYLNMEIISEVYSDLKIASPHGWHASEAFLYLISQ